jgi:Putative metallopeptidase
LFGPKWTLDTGLGGFMKTFAQLTTIKWLLGLLLTALFLPPAAAQQVTVEPWQTLVRNTVSVNAGQSIQYNYSLVTGTILSAQFQVQGGVNDKIQVSLLDADNYQLFLTHRPFRQFPGASGTVRGIGKYTFKIPQDGVYYIVLDNGHALLLPRSVTLHLDAILPQNTLASEQLRIALQALYSKLGQVFIFPDFGTSVRHCGVVNAFSNPNITLCAELLEELQARGVPDVIVFVYLHELGHTMMREWGLPLWDNEDAADEFATAFLLMGKQKKIALDSAQWWQSEGATTQDAVAKIWMDDRHSLSPQRARNIVHWVNNADDITQRWERVFIPHMQTASLQGMLNDPAMSDKNSVKSELSRRNVSTGVSEGQSKCPEGQDMVGSSCAPMCWQDDCKVPIPCGSRVSTGISITKPRDACLKYLSDVAANQGCWLGSRRKDAGHSCYACVLNGDPTMCFEYEDGFFSKEVKIKCGAGRWTSCAPRD